MREKKLSLIDKGLKLVRQRESMYEIEIKNGEVFINPVKKKIKYA